MTFCNRDLRKYIAVIACACAAMSAMGGDITYQIDLTNPLKKARVDQPIAIDLKELSPEIDVVKAVVTDGGKEIPCQIDDLDNDGVADEIAFVIDMPSKGTKKLSLWVTDEGTQTAYEPRVWANFYLHGRKKGETVEIREVTVPGSVNFYNMVYGHGPMFESELVGYRVYFNQKQTLDPYGKFQKRLELKDCKFYPNDEQLAMGFGDDVLLAGNSCGIGAFKGWNDKNATHIEPVDTRTERLVAAGPVRTIVEVDARGWKYNDKKLNMLNRYTLYAGHRDLQVDVVFDKEIDQDLFSTGVERIMGDQTVKYSDHDGIIASWGHHWPVNDTVKYAKETIGIATCVPRENIYGEVDDPDNFLYIVSCPGEKTMKYHTMFTSRKETFGYKDSDEWFGSLAGWKEELENPLKVNVTRKSR